jgi:hypothetical protein
VPGSTEYGNVAFELQVGGVVAHGPFTIFIARMHVWKQLPRLGMSDPGIHKPEDWTLDPPSIETKWEKFSKAPFVEWDTSIKKGTLDDLSPQQYNATIEVVGQAVTQSHFRYFTHAGIV